MISFLESLEFFKSGSFVLTLGLLGASAYWLAAKGKLIAQVLIAIYCWAYMISQFANGNVFGMDQYFIYAGSVGFLYQKMNCSSVWQFLVNSWERLNPSKPCGSQGKVNQPDPYTNRKGQQRVREEEYDKREKIRASINASASPSNATETQATSSVSDGGSQLWWEVLEVAQSASHLEVQKAYEKLMKKYDPKKIVFMGASVQQMAEDKRESIEDAYEEAMKVV